MKEQLLTIKQEALDLIAEAKDVAAMNDIRVKYLGKKGPIQEVMGKMRDMSVEEKKETGAAVNEVKQELAAVIESRMAELEAAEVEARLAAEKIDISLPAQARVMGGKHPLTAIVDESVAFFRSMGYEVGVGPEIETDYYNFEALNLPKNHPARDMQDTFYIDMHRLLRTHTSGVQSRTFEARSMQDLPIQILAPGKVYRRDDDDATHSHQFMQLEGIMIGRDISLAHLKATLQEFVHYMFGPEREIRLRPSYFPFTEPSMEVDVTCAKCGGSGCSICKQTGWIEILGAGMCHPNILTIAGFDPEIVSGFAFGIGVERIAMLKYGVEDIRNFYVNDMRFVTQFKDWGDK
ncbi:phenylalanine--tRNA ligase subunit alpha [Culicoidibacter larvae]|uniref:Phenylalanine--tRNA ligase alpha subunit n=1 Tax=Culicoidibacter larvae TaxID=2579976 RepID=A0A5R8QG03_9FIRM|nr:phenylalanine--tRNA ligase subunit alpha [Culicoidibacter larvae]TLG76714.1 phenylalanine--tRNA ligase subunit alpha [Culicoidibacter larvae]